MLKNLTFTKINDGIVTPFKSTNDEGHLYEGGIYDSKGDLLTKSTRDYGSNCLYKFDESKKTVNLEQLNYVNTNSVFIGHITNHYGHFLLETMSRFWVFLNNYLNKFNIENIVLIKWIDENNKYNLFEIVSNILNLNKYNILIITKATKFSKIFLPQKLCNINKNILFQQKFIYDELIKSSNLDPNFKKFKKIYITRFKGLKRVKNENEIIN